MGTHCCMVIRDLDGNVTRYERTMDGYNLVNEFIHWATDRWQAIPNLERIGTGILEIDDEGEGDQEYGLILDYVNNRFAVVGFPCNKILFYAYKHLYEVKGWNDIPNNDKLWDVFNYPQNQN